MQPLPEYKIPSESDLRFAANEISDLYMFTRISVEQDSIAAYGSGLLDTVVGNLRDLRKGSRFGELECMRPAWNYLHELVSKLQKGSEHGGELEKDEDGEGVSIDGWDCTRVVTYPAIIAGLSWSQIRAELQDILTAIDIDLYEKANPDYSREEAAVAAALHPRLVLK